MRVLLIVSCLLLPILANAGVYRWVGPDGQIHYSDRRMTGAERVAVPVARPSESADEPEASDADAGSYSVFEILRPEPNQTFRNADAKVELSLLIDPPLSDGHDIQILLNGQPIPGETRQTQILLKDLTYGSHRLQARIRDDLDETVATSPPIDFHLRKPVP